MFWNKKKPKSKPQIKTTVPKTFKAKEQPPKWQPTFGETKKKDEKPPEVTTKSESKIDWENKFLKSFQKLTYRHRAWDVWRDYILLHACSISNVLDQENYDQREKRYLKIIRQYSKEEQAIFPELAAYTTMALDQNQEQDFLGKMFMRLDLGNRSAGQFFTPYHVCELMAEVAATNALEKIEQYGYISINDPCCGAGATLIAGVHVIRKQLDHCDPPKNYQNHILVVAQDVDEIVGLMCYIQISLLALFTTMWPSCKPKNAMKKPIPTLTPFFRVVGIALKIASRTLVRESTIKIRPSAKTAIRAIFQSYPIAPHTVYAK